MYDETSPDGPGNAIIAGCLITDTTGFKDF